MLLLKLTLRFDFSALPLLLHCSFYECVSLQNIVIPSVFIGEAKPLAVSFAWAFSLMFDWGGEKLIPTSILNSFNCASIYLFFMFLLEPYLCCHHDDGNWYLLQAIMLGWPMLFVVFWSGNNFMPKGASVLDKPGTLSPEAQVRTPLFLVSLFFVTAVCIFWGL